MYCRNCSNQVNDKAVGCPKCGMDPHKAKNYCPACGHATAEAQVMCTSCGGALASKAFTLDTSALQGFDASAFIANKANITALVALLGCFLPWITVKLFASQSINLFKLSSVADVYPGHILVSALLYLFPLALIGFLAADFVPAITKHKKWFLIASLVLIAYAGIGLYQITHPSMPEVDESSPLAGLMGNAMRQATQMAQNAASVGWGYYLTILATIATYVLGRKP